MGRSSSNSRDGRDGSCCRKTGGALALSNDHVAHTITILTSKNGEGRTVALDDDTWQIIERRWQARAFHNCKTKQTEVSPLVLHRNGRPIRDFRKVWQKALEAAQLPPTGLFHDLRRCGARDMRRAGIDPAIIKRIMGHKTDSMFQRYNISTSDEHREALQRTAELRRERIAAAPQQRRISPLRAVES